MKTIFSELNYTYIHKMKRFQLLSVDEQLKLCSSLGITPIKQSDSAPCSQLGLPEATKDIQGDGNCLFRAISYAISGTENQRVFFAWSDQKRTLGS